MTEHQCVKLTHKLEKNTEIPPRPCTQTLWGVPWQWGNHEFACPDSKTMITENRESSWRNRWRQSWHHDNSRFSIIPNTTRTHYFGLLWDVPRRPVPSWWLQMYWRQIDAEPSATTMLSILQLQTMISHVTHITEHTCRVNSLRPTDAYMRR